MCFSLKELIVKTSDNSNLAYKIIVNQSFLIFFLLSIISLSKSSDCEFIYSLSLCLLGDNVKPKTYVLGWHLYRN